MRDSRRLSSEPLQYDAAKRFAGYDVFLSYFFAASNFME